MGGQKVPNLAVSKGPKKNRLQAKVHQMLHQCKGRNINFYEHQLISWAPNGTEVEGSQLDWKSCDAAPAPNIKHPQHFHTWLRKNGHLQARAPVKTRHPRFQATKRAGTKRHQPANETGKWMPVTVTSQNWDRHYPAQPVDVGGRKSYMVLSHTLRDRANLKRELANVSGQHCGSLWCQTLKTIYEKISPTERASFPHTQNSFL